MSLMSLPENLSNAGCWPNATQKLLLKAILTNDLEESINFWQEWQQLTDIQQLDYGSQRLLPMLYNKLKTTDITHPDLKIYKGIYKQSWYKSQMMLHNILPVLQTFQENNIKAIILKGLALAVLYYKDYGLRPMSDFDILVPIEEKNNAIKIMLSLGWEEGFSWSHSQCFTKQDQKCDLHWHLMSDICSLKTDESSEANKEFWKAIVPLQIKEISVYALCPTDMIFHICVHGAWWNPVAPLRWIVDVMMILKEPVVIDWSRLVTQAYKLQLGLLVRNALNYLKNNFAAPISDEVLKKLDDYKPSYNEQLDYLTKTSPTNERNPLAAFWVCYREYRQYTIGNNIKPNFLGFVKFLRDRWGIEKLSEIPLHSIKEIWQRL